MENGADCDISNGDQFDLGVFVSVVSTSLMLILVTSMGILYWHLGKIRGIIRRYDVLDRAITQHDEFCFKRGIRGRARTFIPACLDNYFSDEATVTSWLSINNLESHIEHVRFEDYSDLLPKPEELNEIDQMRKQFKGTLDYLRRDKKKKTTGGIRARTVLLSDSLKEENQALLAKNV